MQCRICNNRGWVETRFHGPSICPLCKAQKEENEGYSQDAIWTKLINLRDVNLGKQLNEDMENVDISNIIAHFVFDRNVTPQGNLYKDLMGLSPLNKATKLSNDQLLARGYIITQDGKIKTVNDIPVGLIYDCLMKWGGPKDYLAWDMKQPIEIDPSRKGNPLFMDDNLLAIRVKFKDDTDKLTITNAFLTLKDMLTSNDIGTIINWTFR